MIPGCNGDKTGSVVIKGCFCGTFAGFELELVDLSGGTRTGTFVDEDELLAFRVCVAVDDGVTDEPIDRDA